MRDEISAAVSNRAWAAAIVWIVIGNDVVRVPCGYNRDFKLFNKLLLKPDFIKGQKSTGAQKGTAFHTFMERCDLERAKLNPKKEAERLNESGFLSGEELKLLDFKALGRFLGSKLIERAIKSGKYFREYTFTVKINASDYNPELDDGFGNNKIIMQGAVDLAFIEDGEIVIADYKTDRVKDIAKLGFMYKKQLELYKAALEETMNLKVKEIIIYSIYLNQELIL